MIELFCENFGDSDSDSDDSDRDHHMDHDMDHHMDHDMDHDMDDKMTEEMMPNMDKMDGDDIKRDDMNDKMGDDMMRDMDMKRDDKMMHDDEKMHHEDSHMDHDRHGRDHDLPPRPKKNRKGKKDKDNWLCEQAWDIYDELREYRDADERGQEKQAKSWVDDIEEELNNVFDHATTLSFAATATAIAVAAIVM